VVAEGRMTRLQADGLVEWLKARWQDVRPNTDDFIHLAKVTGLGWDPIGQFIATVRDRFDHIPPADGFDPSRHCRPFQGSREEVPGSPAFLASLPE